MVSSGDNEVAIGDFILDCSQPILNTTNINDIQSGLTVLKKYIGMKKPTSILTVSIIMFYFMYYIYCNFHYYSDSRCTEY